MCPSNRAPFLSHEQFDEHWRNNHSKIHVESSPGTCHYEQHVVDEVLTPGAPDADGFGWLSFDSAATLGDRPVRRERGQQAILEDVARFLDPSCFATFATSEYVYRDPATT